MASTLEQIAAGGEVSELVCKQGVGNQSKMLPKLESALKTLPFSFCGPPGTGKKHLLHQVAANAGKELILYDLAHAANEHGVRLEDLKKVLIRKEVTATHSCLCSFSEGTKPEECLLF